MFDIDQYVDVYRDVKLVVYNLKYYGYRTNIVTRKENLKEKLLGMIAVINNEHESKLSEVIKDLIEDLDAAHAVHRYRCDATPDMDLRIRTELLTKNKISAIKLCRELLGWDLWDAKYLVEALPVKIHNE